MTSRTAASRIAIPGSCHCGNLDYTLHWPAGESRIASRACVCTFCRKHGAAWTSNADARLEARIADPDRTSRYRFGTATAEFMICAQCGVAPLVLSEIDGRTYAVINVNTFDDSHGFEVEESATDFDAEDETARLARRKRNWISDVAIDPGPAQSR